jgi:hypothetical protein
MKRLHFLLAFCFALCLTAGYSDSSVTKKVSTIQVAYDYDAADVINFDFSSDLEWSVFDLCSPCLGKATPGNILLPPKALKGFMFRNKAPPDSYLPKIRSTDIK